MTLLDFVLILVLLGFVWFAFWFGLIHAAGGLAGTVVGAWLAGIFYDEVAFVIERLFSYSGPWVRVFTFVAIFILVNRVVGFGFFVLDKTFSFLVRLPFLKTIDRLAGAVLGFAEGGLVLGLTLNFAVTHFVLPSVIQQAIDASRVAFILMSLAAVLVPLLPEAIKAVQPYVPVELPVK